MYEQEVFELEDVWAVRSLLTTHTIEQMIIKGDTIIVIAHKKQYTL